MDDLTVRKAPLPWYVAGILLGLVQILAVGVKKPLGVSTQFVVVDSRVIHCVAPEYAQNHPVIGQEKYTQFGYGFWLDVGLVAGAFTAALAVKRWKLQGTTVWWKQNNHSLPGRFVTGFFAGMLILLGARMAHGCTSGAFMSGWAQFSFSAVPFTITLFGFGMLTAFVIYHKSPHIEE